MEINPTHHGKHHHVDYSSVIEKLEKIQFPLSYSWGVVEHLMGVKNSEDLRKAHETLQPSVIETQQLTGQSLPLFRALNQLLSHEKLDETQQRIINSSILSMKFSGVDLPADQKENFNKLQLELAELSTKFSNNVLDSTKQYKLKLTNKDDIKGLPSSVVASLSQNAKNNGEKDSTPENGPWLITLDFPSYYPCMQHLQSSTIREQLYRAYVTRASDSQYNNEPIIQRILQIRLELSKILGYNNHAEKSLKKKMASKIEAVKELTDMLREKSYPAAQRELQELQEFANKNGYQGKLQLW